MKKNKDEEIKYRGKPKSRKAFKTCYILYIYSKKAYEVKECYVL